MGIQSLKIVASVVARIILFGVGYMLLATSQFHGLDFNLGTLSGIGIIVASLTPYSSVSAARKIGSLLVILTGSILYIFISVEILFLEHSEGLSAADISYLLPLVCLGYLAFRLLQPTNENTNG
ncbi:MAG: hypothetical protein OQL11_06345 [Gammaproteobacteria bacterium]|nr:hypothetical protein [Gammaproteobacteria bacterium]